MAESATNLRPKLYNPAWDEIEHTALLLLDKLKAAGALDEFNTLLAPTRGGLIPAGILCQHFPRSIVVQTIKVTTYGMNREPKEPHLSFMPLLRGRKVLLIDDIVDEGHTSYAVQNWYAEKQDVHITTAALYCREGSQGNYCDFYGATIEKGVWINFPWEPQSAEESHIPF